MKLGGRQTDLTAVQPPGPHSMPWRCFLEGIIYYTNGQSSWASVRFHILCLYRTWTVWRWFHPGVNINRFQQHTAAQDHIQGVQEAAGPCLGGMEAHGAHITSHSPPTGLIINAHG